MTETMPELTPVTARKIFAWQMLFFAVLLTVWALNDGYSVAVDRAQLRQPLPLWMPIVWESSSHLLIWLLIPLLGWWLARFPLARHSWWRNLPAHLLATAPFSLLHVIGMVGIRKIAYWTMSSGYDFGPFWDRWFYEYRKDFVAYWIVIGALLGFRVYGLWLDARSGQLSGASVRTTPDTKAPQERLVVRKRNREFILDANAIDRIDAAGNYVVVHAASENYRLRDSLEGIVQRLGEQRFARVHRAHVVNIDRIREIQPWDHGDYRILLKDGSFINLGLRDFAWVKREV